MVLLDEMVFGEASGRDDLLGLRNKQDFGLGMGIERKSGGDRDIDVVAMAHLPQLFLSLSLLQWQKPAPVDGSGYGQGD